MPSKYQAPVGDGEVFVLPQADRWLDIARDNHKQLSNAPVQLAGRSLGYWRNQLRSKLYGQSDRLVFCLGHQPEFMHAGVWAKIVAVQRAAQAAGGHALNLIADSDAPTSGALRVPVASGSHLSMVQVPFLAARAGASYEELPAVGVSDRKRIEAELRTALGDRFDRTQLHAFLHGLGKTDPASGWVTQYSVARSEVESEFDVAIRDARVSELWGGAFLYDLLQNAERFAVAYNRALDDFRKTNRVRQSNRPMPDLQVSGNFVELPLWGYRSGEARSRVFAHRQGETITLDCAGQIIAQLDNRRLLDDSTELSPANFGDWKLRPRALVLTIWGRLLLADLFVHGIGGATYDAISDKIIEDHYGVAPPRFACVSATLRLPLPRSGFDQQQLAKCLRLIRDLQHNPDRHLSPSSSDVTEAKRRLLAEADRLSANEPRNRAARRWVFEDMRTLNARAMSLLGTSLAARRTRLNAIRAGLASDAVADDREFFFALHDRSALELLLRALPSVDDFRVCCPFGNQANEGTKP